MSSTQPSHIKVAVVGLGYQGTGIADLLIDHGYDFIGAVDAGEKVGKPLREFVPHRRTPDRPVYGTIGELIEATGTTPDAVALAVSIPADAATELAADILSRGINVLTLTEDLFEVKGPHAERLNAVAKAHNVTMIAGGIQDILWVHLPAVAAASTSHLKRLILDDFADASIFPYVVGQLDAGMDMNSEQFAHWLDERLREPPIQGAPIRELARLLGFTPDETKYEITPYLATEPTYWSEANVTVPVGNVIGAKYVVSISTKEGPQFEGILVFKIATEGEAERNSIIVVGKNTLTLLLPKPDYGSCVWLGIVRRVPDIINAPAGFVPVADLPAPKYTHAIG